MKFGSSRDLVEEGPMEAVRLQVQDGSESIVCRISREALEALMSRVVSEPGDLLGAAHDYFELLTDKWAHRIHLGACERDGTVLLRKADVVGYLGERRVLANQPGPRIRDPENA